MTTYDTRNIKISVPSIYASRAELFTLYTAIMQLAIEGNLWTREARAIFDALATGAGLMIDAPPASVVSGAYTEIDNRSISLSLPLSRK